MSSIADCPDCCDCPAPAYRRAVNTSVYSKTGCVECIDPLPAVPKVYRSSARSGVLSYFVEGDAGYGFAYAIKIVGGSTHVSPRPGGTDGADGTYDYEIASDCGSIAGDLIERIVDCPYQLLDDLYDNVITDADCRQPVTNVCTSPTSVTFAINPSGGGACTVTACEPVTLSFTLSVEYTTAELLEDVIAVLPGFGAFSTALPGVPHAVLDLSTDERDALARAERYQIIHKVPLTATCYRAEWIERFVPAAGAAITSVDVFRRGSGYTSPTVSVTDPTGAGASITATVVNGRITAFVVVDGGTGYTAPSISISDPSGTGAQAGCVHFGTETIRSAQWDGTTPGGYDPEDEDTWPRLTPDGDPDSYWEMGVPEELGTTEVVCLSFRCRACE